MKKWLLCLAVVGGLFVLASTTWATTPLVTGDLDVYYSFDSDWSDVVPNDAGEAFALAGNGDGEVTGRVFRDDTDPVRGPGVAVFDGGGMFRPDILSPAPDPTWYPDDGIQLGDVTPDGWGKALTLSVWAKLTPYTDQCDPACAKDQTNGLIEIYSEQGSYVTHFEARTDGKLRGRIRGQFQSENIVKTAVYTDGSGTSTETNHWPVDTWFQYAETYDSNGTFGGQPGHWAQYYNGQKIAEGAANGDMVPVNGEAGGWGGHQAGSTTNAGSTVGHVSDDNRQTNGYMDELYIFHRALSDAEILTLYEANAPLLGDVNQDRAVDGLDVAPFVTLVTAGTYQLEADMNGDLAVDGLDVAPFVDAVLGGGVASVPEPTTLMLAGLGLLGLVCFRRRRG